MKIYLDNCCFNRPYDDQSNIKNQLETEAKIFIQEMMKKKEIQFVWSYILDFENAQNPYTEKKNTIQSWKVLASAVIAESEPLIILAESLQRLGLKAKDALHVACAIIAHCDYFVTTDIRLLHKKKAIPQIQLVNPLDLIQLLGEVNEN